MGPYSEVVLVCMYVCMSVRNGFTTEIYEFTYSECTDRHGSLLKPGTERNDGGTFRSVPPTKIRKSVMLNGN